MLYFIVNPATINKIRLDAGIKRALELYTQLTLSAIAVIVARNNQIIILPIKCKPVSPLAAEIVRKGIGIISGNPFLNFQWPTAPSNDLELPSG
jgi:hypothetical protein